MVAVSKKAGSPKLTRSNLRCARERCQAFSLSGYVLCDYHLKQSLTWRERRIERNRLRKLNGVVLFTKRVKPYKHSFAPCYWCGFWFQTQVGSCPTCQTLFDPQKSAAHERRQNKSYFEIVHDNGGKKGVKQAKRARNLQLTSNGTDSIKKAATNYLKRMGWSDRMVETDNESE